MPFRIQVLGPFRLSGPDQEPIHLRSNARLLTYLAVRAPYPVPRRALVNALWPDVDPSTGSNRLRVALSKLRSLLPDLFLESQDGLTLDPAAVQTDIAEFEALLQDSANTTSEEDEFEAIYRAYECFTENQGNPPFDSWLVSDLQDVIEEFTSACTRGAELGLKYRREARALEMCTAALALAPGDVPLTALLLRARFQLGQRGEAAVRDVVSGADRTLLANQEIRSLIDQIVKGTTAGQAVADEEKLAHAILEALIERNPALARAVLSSPETLSIAGSNPRLMLTLLERAVAQDGDQDSHWERCVARICGLKAWLGDAQGVFDYSARLVEKSENPIILRAVWNAIGVAHSLRRDWDLAMAAVDTTIRYAQEGGSEIDVLSAKGNRANYYWQQGEYEKSLREYDENLRAVQAIDTPQAQFEYVIGFSNKTFIPVMRRDWSTALAWIDESANMRQGPGDVPLGLLLPCWALAKVATGDRAGVFPMLRQAFLNAAETGSERTLQITFEFAACVLGFTSHKDFGHAVLDWVDEWRHRTQLPRCRAELDLVHGIFGKQKSRTPIPADESPSKVGSELLRRLRQELRDC